MTKYSGVRTNFPHCSRISCRKSVAPGEYLRTGGAHHRYPILGFHRPFLISNLSSHARSTEKSKLPQSPDPSVVHHYALVARETENEIADAQAGTRGDPETNIEAVATAHHWQFDRRMHPTFALQNLIDRKSEHGFNFAIVGATGIRSHNRSGDDSRGPLSTRTSSGGTTNVAAMALLARIRTRNGTRNQQKHAASRETSGLSCRFRGPFIVRHPNRDPDHSRARRVPSSAIFLHRGPSGGQS